MRANGVRSRYVYDALGPNAASVAYTRFLYRGGHVLAEADSAGP